MEMVAGHRALHARARRAEGPAVAIGNFDGVHRGHQRLFAEILTRSRARGAEAIVLTFDPHPAKVLAPAYAPPLICTPIRKLDRIAAAGVDACVVEPFDRDLAGLTPEAFIEQVLVAALGAREVVVGHDFTFGRGRAGDAHRLAALGAAHGFATTVVDPVTVDGIVCSSTKVREFVLEGRIEGAALLLGRDPEIEGTVVAGAGRGRTIGIPTANLRPDTELLPAVGVYAGWALLDDGARFDAAINVGTNPTFGGAALCIEAHLLDYPGGDLVGRAIRVGLTRRLRAERRFPSVEALVAQIKQDIAAVRGENRGAA
jgi:riboflavin kinase/FMN adenylyltransferase